MIDPADPPSEPDPRRQGRLRWTPAKEQAFLDELHESANVRRAARAIGYSYTGVYRRRVADPEFHKRWEEAYAAGYDRLEAAVLERALAAAGKGGIEDELAAQPMTIRDVITLLVRQDKKAAAARARTGWRNRAPDPQGARAAILKQVLAIKRARKQPAPPEQ